MLLGVTPKMGILMELQDCVLLLLKDVIVTDSEEIAFEDLDAAVPMRERKDLLEIMNIFNIYL